MKTPDSSFALIRANNLALIRAKLESNVSHLYAACLKINSKFPHNSSNTINITYLQKLKIPQQKIYLNKTMIASEGLRSGRT